MFSYIKWLSFGTAKMQIKYSVEPVDDWKIQNQRIIEAYALISDRFLIASDHQGIFPAYKRIIANNFSKEDVQIVYDEIISEAKGKISSLNGKTDEYTKAQIVQCNAAINIITDFRNIFYREIGNVGN